MTDEPVPWWRAALAEGAAVFLFVGGALSLGTALDSPQPAFPFLVGGLYMAAVYAVAHISGAQLNPALTLALWVIQRLTFGRMAAYLGAQLLGTGAAWLLLRLATPEGDGSRLLFPREGTSPGGILLLAAFFTFFLTFVYGATLLDRRAAPGIFGIALGAVVAGAAFLGLPLHPGEALVLELWAKDFSLAWAFSLGPLLGALLGGLLYEGIWHRQGESHPLP